MKKISRTTKALLAATLMIPSICTYAALAGPDPVQKTAPTHHQATVQHKSVHAAPKVAPKAAPARVAHPSHSNTQSQQ